MQVPENHANFLGDPNTIEAALSYNSKGWNVIPIPKPGEIIRKTWDANLQKSVDIKADGKSAEGYGFWDPWKQNKQTKEDVIRLFKDRDNCNLALVTGKVSSIIAFDIDGKDAKDHFFSTIEKLNDPAIKDAIKNTMQTKTGSGNGIHIIIKYNTKEYTANEYIKSMKLWIGKNKHSEISLKAGGSYLIVPPSTSITGNRYEFTNDTEPLTISKENISKILSAFNSYSVKKTSSIYRDNNPNNKNNTTSLANLKKPNLESNFLSKEQKEKLIEKLRDVYVEGQRDYIIFGLSGLLFKKMYGIDSVKDFVNDLCVYYNDEQLDQRIRVVDDTYQKWVTGQEVTGISHLYEIFEKMLDSKRDAVRLINSLSNIIGDSKVHSLFQNSQTELPDNIREELSNHVYKITSIGSSKKVIIAHTGLKQTVTGFINKINKKEKKQDDTDNSSNKNEDIFKYELNFGDILIDAIPTKIIIYDNPIDKSHNYEITFSTISEKKPLKIGPGSLEYIINELQLRNKILKKSNIHDAISAIISAFIETEKAIIHDNVVNPGYYFLDGTFIASDTNQSFIHISISPPPTSKPVLQGSSLVDVNNVNAYSEIDKDTKEKIYSCIQLLDELDSKWPKGFFSTVIKWALISPFSFILKQNRRWMPYLFLYGYSRSGKNTLGCISLAIWKKYEKSRRKENNYEIGFGKINSEARLGHVLSMDTYPRLVNEVGVLTEPKNLNLIEMIKSAVENQDVRGIMVNYRNYTSISALSPLILTSNRSPPPDDSGFMRRIISLYFDKFSSKTREEAKVFEKWLDPQMDKFGILGDFAYSYIKEKPGLLNGDLEWGVIAKDILVSFYSAVRKNPPAWIEDMIENNTLEENKDNTTIEFRAFLINETNEHYNKYIRNFSNTLTSNQTSTGYVVTNSEFTDRLEFCLDNGVIPYMVNHTYKNGEEKVCITTPILKEIFKKKVGNNNLKTLTDIANEIPNFEYGNRTINKKSVKMVFGLKQHFIEFLKAEVEDIKEE